MTAAVPHHRARTGVACLAAVAMVAAGAATPMAAAGPVSTTATPSPATHTDSPDRLLVTLRDGAAEAGLPDGTAEVARLGPVRVVELAPGADVDATAAMLRRDPAVADVEVDGTIRPATFDPGYPQQWHLENTGQSITGRAGTAGQDLDIEEAWRFTRGAGSTIALLDTGVDVDHPDLAGAIATNPREALNGIDDDGNGFVDDTIGWDFTSGDATVYDDPAEDAHGTELTGLMVARANNGIGIAGVAPQARVLPVKIVRNGTGRVSDAVAGLAYAVDRGADVVVLSWIGAEGSAALRTAIRAADLPVVVPSGNDGTVIDAGARVRDSQQLGNLVVATSATNSGWLAPFAVRGRAGVDVLAPGWRLISTTSGGNYARISGTSLAAANTGAVLALAAATAPSDTTAAELVDLLLRTTRPRDALFDDVATSGFVDAGASVLGAIRLRPTRRCDDAPPPTFGDVAADGVHAAGVGCVTAEAITAGFPDGSFRPSNTLTRGQLATMLVRLRTALGLPEPTGVVDAYSDDDGDLHERDADLLAAAGVLDVPDDRRFEPQRSATRLLTVDALHRVVTSTPLGFNFASRRWFTDAPSSANSAGRMRDLGVLRGTGGGLLGSYDPVLRGEAASLFAGTLDAVGDTSAE